MTVDVASCYDCPVTSRDAPMFRFQGRFFCGEHYVRASVEGEFCSVCGEKEPDWIYQTGDSISEQSGFIRSTHYHVTFDLDAVEGRDIYVCVGCRLEIDEDNAHALAVRYLAMNPMPEEFYEDVPRGIFADLLTSYLVMFLSIVQRPGRARTYVGREEEH